MHENEPGEIPASESSTRSWPIMVGLAALPVLIAIGVYYSSAGPESAIWQLRGDQVFYDYQMSRAAEVDGKWWKIPEDRRLGWPYQSEIAKYPHLLEGLDLLLISSVSARFLDPVMNYHLLVLSVIAINGWVAGGLTLRLTRSTTWAVAAILLTTLNGQIAGRMQCHLHLFKWGWFLLAAWAFWRFLEAPTWRRGVALGLAVALVLQGSFYFGYFVALTFGLWWLGTLVAGRFDRRCLTGTAAALAVFVPLAALITYPALAVTKNCLLADVYARRPLKDTWLHSSELWQYFVPIHSTWAREYVEAIGVKPFDLYGEGWNFPGFAVLLGIGAYGVARFRGVRLTEAQGFLDLLMGQIGLLVLLSLSGGAPFWLHRLVPSIRAYGRSGNLAMALGCVAAPLVFHGWLGRSKSRWLRASMAAVIFALIAYDGYEVHNSRHWQERTADKTPAWVDWLAKQPPEVKLAAFSPIDDDYWFGMASYRMRHQHTTLNGCDWELLNGDLKLLGASYLEMNREGLKFVTSLGYNTLAFHRDYLKAHPWIESLPWLGSKTQLGEWRIYRAGQGTPHYPPGSLQQVLATQVRPSTPAQVPSQVWITDRLDLEETMVVMRPKRIFLAWARPNGTRVSDPIIGLYQHVFGPDLPAYSIETPKQAGPYELQFLDDKGKRLASRPYVVSETLRTSVQFFGEAPPNLWLNKLPLKQSECASGQVRIVLENRTPHYIQAHASRKKELGTARVQPGIAMAEVGSAFLVAKYQRGEEVTDELVVMLPSDIPPGGRLEMKIPVHPEALGVASSRIDLSPFFFHVDPKLATESRSDQVLNLSLEPEQLAKDPGKSIHR